MEYYFRKISRIQLLSNRRTYAQFINPIVKDNVHILSKWITVFRKTYTLRYLQHYVTIHISSLPTPPEY